MFERIVNSKLYSIVDQIVRVVWLNVLIIITTTLGLFFFTFGPALLAGTYVVKLIYQKYEGPITKIYFKAFKQFFVKGMSIFLIYSLVIIVLAFNIYFFMYQMETKFNWLSFISFMLSFILLGLSVVSLIHSMLLSTCYTKSGVWDLIKSGIKLTLAFTLRSLLYILTLLGIIAISYVIPLLIFLVSLYGILIAIEFILFRAYNKIPAFGEASNEVAHELTI